MTWKRYGLGDEKAFRAAGGEDLIELLPAPGAHHLYIQKWILEALAWAIVNAEYIHLSGPTGTAKSSLLEALGLVDENFLALCRAMDLEARPIRLYPIEMATFELPGELYQRRAIKDGSTWDEESLLVKAIRKAADKEKSVYPLIWLREVGRVHSSAVQGGLLNLMSRIGVILPNGDRIDTAGIGWVADSNYQSAESGRHTLAPLDDALRRRFSVNLTLDYLSGEQEESVLYYLLESEGLAGEQGLAELIGRAVALGAILRRQRREGNLQTLTPPTLYGYLSFVRMALALKHLPLSRVAALTLLGNAGEEDLKQIPGLLSEVFGSVQATGEDPVVSRNLL